MEILDTFTTIDGESFTLSEQNNGDFVITDSAGVIRELVGLTRSEAFDIFYTLDPDYHRGVAHV